MDQNLSVTFQILSVGSIRAELSVFAAYMAKQGARLSQFMGHSGYIFSDRNAGIDQWLKGGNERGMIQCDEDMVPSLTILDLAKHGVDLVGSTYLCNSDRGMMPAAKGLNEPCLDCAGPECGKCGGAGVVVPSAFPKESEDAPDLKEVDWVGTGCYYISRRLVEDLIARDGQVFRIHTDERGLKKEGVDVDLCRRARRLGYKVYLDRGQICGHAKTQTWAPSREGILLQIPWGTYWERDEVPKRLAERKPVGDLIRMTHGDV